MHDSSRRRRRDDPFPPLSGGARPASDGLELVPASEHMDPYNKYSLPPHDSGAYCIDDFSGFHPEADHGGITSGSSIRGIDNGGVFHPEVDHGGLTRGTSIRGIDNAGGYHPEPDHGRVASGTNIRGLDDGRTFHPEADRGGLRIGSSNRGIDDVRGYCPEADHDRVTSRTSIRGLDDGRGFHSEADHGGLTSGTSRGIDDARSYHPHADNAQLTSGTSSRGYPSPLGGPILQGQRLDAVPIPSKESNILFVDRLPTDCTRREVGYLFHPFIGFREIRVIHKEPRRSGDKSMVFCFVEFADLKCAFTAMEALQGYKFDDKKSDSPVLKIQHAHFPFRLASDKEVQPFGGLR
ncbi:OLC1v1029290C1 [Oldenlandia corymbosa var. corymbosa]|uniref:OLC1v1029290C1 n=1 Tax=Oldenlandia corymbosa var. corymbosa TaxID=529605 RepID=A0AAV1CE82_OLDCO|nr:OLC1v1029290C1 [Oldenlandia corymbosa var. corymbosa]